MKRSPAKKPLRQFVLITGLSGSGKGSVLKSFEDLGFYCVDNLPADLIPKFADLCRQPGSRIERAAMVVDIRGGEALSQLPAMYHNLSLNHHRPSLVFLETSDKVLMQRFEETRRPHPMGRDLPVREGIRLERMLLKPMRQLADVVIDTTRMNVHELRDVVQERFGGVLGRKTILLSVVSFGFRFGVPSDADLVFDVRFLPNPNYVPVYGSVSADAGVCGPSDGSAPLSSAPLHSGRKKLPHDGDWLHRWASPVRGARRRDQSGPRARRLQDQAQPPRYRSKLNVGGRT